MVRKKHERIRQNVVHITVSFPKVSVEVLWPLVRPLFMEVLIVAAEESS
jgi:hypothetical protein